MATTTVILVTPPKAAKPKARSNPYPDDYWHPMQDNDVHDPVEQPDQSQDDRADTTVQPGTDNTAPQPS